MNGKTYKKISISRGDIKNEVQELREIYFENEILDKYLKQNQKMFNIGFWIFWGMIGLGIIQYFIWGNNKTIRKKTAGKKQNNINFNLIHFGV